jgi:broad specificity phosphatase PhoE
MPERRLFFITHADVAIDPDVPVPDWGLNDRGRARHTAFAAGNTLAHVASVWSSAEQKAIDGAQITAAALGLTPRIVEALHENDRSATGFLPPDEFEATANAFFAQPEASIRGWERAIDAQTRIVSACQSIVADAPQGAIAIIAHGGVGALLNCHLRNVPISRRYDQPAGKGGNLLTVALPDWTLLRDWTDIAPEVS